MTLTDPTVRTALTTEAKDKDAPIAAPPADRWHDVDPNNDSQLINAIAAEHGLPVEQVIGLISYFDDMIRSLNNKRHRTTVKKHLRDTDIVDFYPALEAVMPHGAESTPGSTHELLERRYTTGRRQVTLLHTMTADEGTKPKYCNTLAEASYN